MDGEPMRDEIAKAYADAKSAWDIARNVYIHACVPIKQLPRDEWPAFIAGQAAKYRLKELSDAVTVAREALSAQDGGAL